MRGRHSSRRVGRGTIVVLVVTFVLFAGVAGTAFAGMSYDRSHADRILPGIRVDGVDVGGLTRAAAVAAVQPIADRALAATITIRAGKLSWTKTLADLGVSTNVASAVDLALKVSDQYPWWVRTYHRIADKPVPASFNVPLAYDTTPIGRFVTSVAKRLRVAPVDAAYALVGGRVRFTHDKDGSALMTTVANDALVAAVRDGKGSVDLRMKTIHAKIQDEATGRLIVVNVSKNTLVLYDGFKPLRRYGVATAMQGFVTPDGAWQVVRKAENPTWYNPCFGEPDCWAADEPEMIPPGPGNPLGTRALYLDAPGIRIHGTPSDSSIGHWASHGCIRMHIPQSEALYPLVPVGTPVFIVGAPPWGVSENAGPAG
jgi:lipoprotein-anchoring transpeptidase ErfK/SrfK